MSAVARTAGKADPPIRLFCLPHAGGSAVVYGGWGRMLGPRFSVASVELPGHGRRIREPLLTSAAALVERLLDELLEDMRTGPFAVFGHSMGGLLAFRLAHELVRGGLPRPLRLFISAVRAPGHTTGLLHALPDAELVAALGRLNGASPEVLAHRELVELMLPIVRADLRITEQWSFVPAEALDIPVSLLAGASDPLAPPHEMERWREHFAGEVERRSYPGDHFYLHTEAEALLRDIGAALTGSD
jgi:medium-chain acyl-[acyl-carrier-protein] hydrolase